MRYKMILISMVLLLAMSTIAFAQVDGATTIVGVPETKTADTAGSATADGGNITSVTLGTESKTGAWQGFFGEVSGNITLEDTSGDTLYEWPITSLSGEVFATSNSSLDWSTVSAVTDCTTDETLTGTGNDKVSSTFTLNASLTGWTVSGTAITSACQVFTYVNSAAQATNFEEIILAATGVTSIYATKINSDTVGFEGATHDYQLLVPDDSAAATTTTYYFYAEFD